MPPLGARCPRSEPGAPVRHAVPPHDPRCPPSRGGCDLTLRVQDDAIVNVTSPDDHDVTRGNLCIKGRFGYRYVQTRKPA